MIFPRPPLAAAAALLFVNAVLAPGAHAPAAAPLMSIAMATTAEPTAEAEVVPPAADLRVVRVETGDTLMALLVDAGAAAE